jgi:protein ImuA
LVIGILVRFVFFLKTELDRYDTFVHYERIRMLASAMERISDNLSWERIMDCHSPMDTIRRLREQLGQREAMATAEDPTVFSSGAAPLDRLLPGGGLRYGMLVEWLAGGRGVVEQWSSGVDEQRSSHSSTPPPHYCTTPLPNYCSSSAVTLSLLGAREACRQGGVLVVIDQERTFYPPAAAAWGIDLARLIIVHPRTTGDALWAAIQSLRSPAVAAMWTAVDRLDSRAFRRLQLAAGAGRTLGLLVRPASVRGQPSWADMQLCPWSVVRGPWWKCNGQRTTDNGRHVHIHITRLRGARPGGHVTLEIDDATHCVREAKEGYRLSAIGYQPGLLADSR